MIKEKCRCLVKKYQDKSPQTECCVFINMHVIVALQFFLLLHYKFFMKLNEIIFESLISWHLCNCFLFIHYFYSFYIIKTVLYQVLFAHACLPTAHP